MLNEEQDSNCKDPALNYKKIKIHVKIYIRAHGNSEE